MITLYIVTFTLSSVKRIITDIHVSIVTNTLAMSTADVVWITQLKKIPLLHI